VTTKNGAKTPRCGARQDTSLALKPCRARPLSPSSGGFLISAGGRRSAPSTFLKVSAYACDESAPAQARELQPGSTWPIRWRYSADANILLRDGLAPAEIPAEVRTDLASACEGAAALPNETPDALRERSNAVARFGNLSTTDSCSMPCGFALANLSKVVKRKIWCLKADSRQGCTI